MRLNPVKQCVRIFERDAEKTSEENEKVKDGKEETKTEENEGEKYFLMHAYSRMNASKTTQIIIPHTHSHRCSHTHTQTERMRKDVRTQNTPLTLCRV